MSWRSCCPTTASGRSAPWAWACSRRSRCGRQQRARGACQACCRVLHLGLPALPLVATMGAHTLQQPTRHPPPTHTHTHTHTRTHAHTNPGVGLGLQRPAAARVWHRLGPAQGAALRRVRQDGLQRARGGARRLLRPLPGARGSVWCVVRVACCVRAHCVCVCVLGGGACGCDDAVRWCLLPGGACVYVCARWAVFGGQWAVGSGKWAGAHTWRADVWRHCACAPRRARRRPQVRMHEMRESLRIVYQCLNEMPEGPYKSIDGKVAPPRCACDDAVLPRASGCGGRGVRHQLGQACACEATQSRHPPPPPPARRAPL
jgi:hypothetical protein